jgi:hypothetical protein
MFTISHHYGIGNEGMHLVDNLEHNDGSCDRFKVRYTWLSGKDYYNSLVSLSDDERLQRKIRAILLSSSEHHCWNVLDTLQRTFSRLDAGVCEIRPALQII